MSVLHEFTKLVPHEPKGNQDELNQAADYWDATATSLQDMVSDLRARTSTAAASWSGPAHDAFEKEYSTLADAVTDSVTQLQALAKTLRELGTDISEAQHKYKAAMIGAGITIAVGAALTVVTLTASDDVAIVAVGAEVGGAVEVAETAATTASVVLSSTADFAMTIATRFAVNFGITIAAQMVGTAIAYPDHNPFSHLDFKDAVIAAGGLTAFGLVLPGLTNVIGATGLSTGMSTVIAGGLAGSGIDAISEELTTGSIDPFTVLFSGGLGAITAGVATRFGRGEVAETGLPKSATIEDNGYYFKTDRNGYGYEFGGTLKAGTGQRLRTATARAVVALGRGSGFDDAGHMIARRFLGPREAYNLVPQDSNLNRGAWRAMENQWANDLKAKHEVVVRIRAIRRGVDPRPIRFKVRWTVNGQPFERTFENFPYEVAP